MNKIDQILKKYGVGGLGRISAKSQLKQAILEGLPKKRLTPHPEFSEYNQVLDDVTQSIERLFEG